MMAHAFPAILSLGNLNQCPLIKDSHCHDGTGPPWLPIHTRCRNLASGPPLSRILIATKAPTFLCSHFIFSYKNLTLGTLLKGPLLQESDLAAPSPGTPWLPLQIILQESDGPCSKMLTVTLALPGSQSIPLTRILLSGLLSRILIVTMTQAIPGSQSNSLAGI